MARCKYCHEVISRLDKDVCPFCGGQKPLDGTDTSTQDVTKVIDQLEKPLKIKHKKRIVAAIIAVLVGFLGGHYFYLGKFKKGLIMALISVLLIGGFGSILFFAIPWHNAFAFLIPYFVIEVVCLFFGYVLLTNRSIQDSHGEFLD